jgi:hypothetical protein
LNVPAAVGVPEMVIVLPAHDALTPAGKPLAPLTPALLIPVAPVVVNWIVGLSAWFWQAIRGVEDVTVLSGATTRAIAGDIGPVQPDCTVL